MGSTSIFTEFPVLSMVISQVSQFSRNKYFANLQTEYPAAYILAMAWLNSFSSQDVNPSGCICVCILIEVLFVQILLPTC